VYLLDHEYSPRGLNWSRLKGVDAERVSALRAAAQAPDCEIALALADVHETWNAYEPHEYGRYRWRDEDDQKYELDDLIEMAVGLDSWVDTAAADMDPIATSVAEGEVCATTPNESLTPYESEYEGYMGNYDNTLDRRYHRGAVVVWPRERDFAVRAEASPAWALGRLAELVGNGEPNAARELAGTLGSFWAHVPAATKPLSLGSAAPSAEAPRSPEGGARRRPRTARTLATAPGVHVPHSAARRGACCFR